MGWLGDRWRVLRARLDAQPTWLSAGFVFLTLTLVYLSTANWHQAQVNDTVAAIFPAQRLGQHGTWLMQDVPSVVPWFIAVDGGYLSNRFPGTILHGVPAYWLFGIPDAVTNEPGALTSVVLAALAMTVLHLVLRRVTTPSRAAVGALVAGFATSTWGISASALWSHTPGQLWLALGVLGLATEAYLRSGLAFGVALLVRPQTAVIAAVAGLVRGLQDRRLRPVVLVAVGTGVGLLAYLVYNLTVLSGLPAERASLAGGGYGGRPVSSLWSMPLGVYATNVLGLLVSPSRGALVQSPFLLVLLAAGGRPAWRAAPGWVRATAIAAVAYLLVQARVNGFNGGGDQLVYRLPLEALTVAAPFLALAYDRAVAGRRVVAPLFWSGVGLAIAVQILAAVTWDNHQGPGGTGPTFWSLAEWRVAVRLTGAAWTGVLAAAGAGVGLVAVAGRPGDPVPQVSGHDDAP